MVRGLIRLAIVLCGLGVAAAAFAWYLFERPGPLADSTNVVIAKGSGVRGIAEQLTAAGVVDHPLLLAVGAKLVGGGAPLKAGEYVFPAHVSPHEVVSLLQSGKTVVRRLTVAEGLTVMQIKALLRDAEGLNGDVDEVVPEGSLLPETYHYSWGDDRAEVLQRMQDAMRRTLDELWEQRAEGLPLKSKEEALVLASIVERETGVAEERPRVAAVFLNRLRRGMKLQSDPTVIYGASGGAGTLDRPLSKADLAAPNTHNTYVIDGLPPSPIANPGAAAIRAVLQPADADDLYFVADGSGGHVFAKTLAEHNRNVAKWRQIERQQRQNGAPEKAPAD